MSGNEPQRVEELMSWFKTRRRVFGALLLVLALTFIWQNV